MSPRATLLCIGALAVLTSRASGQGGAPGDRGVRPVASLRLRAERSDWFDPGAQGRYGLAHGLARVGATQRRRAFEWRVEGAVPFFVGLPEDATLPAPAGALGLGATVWSRDVARAHRVVHAVKAGAVGINCWAPIDPRLPWGGVKTSGIGRECGLSGVLAYTEEKAITVLLR